jgi:hypothetical protein
MIKSGKLILPNAWATSCCRRHRHINDWFMSCAASIVVVILASLFEYIRVQFQFDLIYVLIHSPIELNFYKWILLFFVSYPFESKYRTPLHFFQLPSQYCSSDHRPPASITSAIVRYCTSHRFTTRVTRTRTHTQRALGRILIFRPCLGIGPPRTCGSWFPPPGFHRTRMLPGGLAYHWHHRD